MDKALIIYVKYIVVVFAQSSPNRNKEGIIIMDKLLERKLLLKHIWMNMTEQMIRFI